MGQVRAEGTGVEWKRNDRIKDEKEKRQKATDKDLQT